MELINELKAKGYTLKRIERECNMPSRTLQPGRKIPSKYLDKVKALLSSSPSVSPIKTIKASHKVDNHGILRSIGEDGKLYSYKPTPGDQFFQLNQGCE